MVTSFGCSCVDGLGAAQNPSPWRCCKVLGKIGESRIDGRGIVMDMECGMGMLSCMIGRYWSVGLCSGVGGSGGGGVGVNVDGADGVGSGGGIGSAVGDGCGDNGRNVDGSWLCGGGI